MRLRARSKSRASNSNSRRSCSTAGVVLTTDIAVGRSFQRSSSFVSIGRTAGPPQNTVLKRLPVAVVVIVCGGRGTGGSVVLDGCGAAGRRRGRSRSFVGRGPRRGGSRAGAFCEGEHAHRDDQRLGQFLK